MRPMTHVAFSVHGATNNKAEPQGGGTYNRRMKIKMKFVTRTADETGILFFLFLLFRISPLPGGGSSDPMGPPHLTFGKPLTTPRP